MWSAAALLIALIGLSRVYLGVHWPSDVIAGYAAALIWMGAVRILALKLEDKKRS
jgi:undecaprenyl-diphosphatase